jgi:hypothetical protein
VSWARFAPGVNQSAGKRNGKTSTGHGNRYLARVLGDIAVCCGRSDSFLGERYRRIARRRGTKRAIVAVGRSVLIIVWHLLNDPDAHFADLGADYYPTHHTTQRAKRNHVRQLQAMATRSPWNPPPNPPSHPTAWTRLRCAAPGAAGCPPTGDFRIRPPPARRSFDPARSGRRPGGPSGPRAGARPGRMALVPAPTCRKGPC